MKSLFQYFLVLAVSLLFLIGCGENSISKNLHVKDNNIGTTEPISKKSLLQEKLSITSEDKLRALYIACFDRAPDLAGLTYWKDEFKRLTTENALTEDEALEEITSQFSKNPVFAEKYNKLDDKKFIEAIYRNILGESGDEEGIEHWIRSLKKITRTDFINQFIKSALEVEITPENFPNLSSEELEIAKERKSYILNKQKVSQAFNDIFGENTNVDLETEDIAQTPEYIASEKVLKQITANPKSVEDIIRLMNKIKDEGGKVKELIDAIDFFNTTPDITIRIDLNENRTRTNRLTVELNNIPKNKDGTLAVETVEINGDTYPITWENETPSVSIESIDEIPNNEKLTISYIRYDNLKSKGQEVEIPEPLEFYTKIVEITNTAKSAHAFFENPQPRDVITVTDEKGNLVKLSNGEYSFTIDENQMGGKSIRFYVEGRTEIRYFDINVQRGNVVQSDTIRVRRKDPVVTPTPTPTGGTGNGGGGPI